MTKGIKRKLNKVTQKVRKRINDSTDRDSLYSRGLSVEGYNGGYIQALSDVRLVLDGIHPNSSRFADFWKDE